MAGYPKLREWAGLSVRFFPFSEATPDTPLWQWNPADGDMPGLPPQQHRQLTTPLP